MTDTLDFKKEDKDLYLPKAKPSIVDVPEMGFFFVDGKGNPNTCDAYKNAIEVLYGLSYTIKMSKKQGTQPQGFFDYVVPPLEGLWWSENNSECLMTIDKDTWHWTAMIRQPDFVTEDVLESSKKALAKKKPLLDISVVRLDTFTEGLCAHILHTGPYDDEQRSIHILNTFIEEKEYRVDISQTRKHHEIYLNNPQKTIQEKLKTVLRHPIIKA